MLRHIAIFALLSASPCFAQTVETGPAPNASSAQEAFNGQEGKRDPFVIANDACGASRYAHLVGESYSLHRASIPEDAILHGPGHEGAVNVIDDRPVQPPTQLSTLEFRSHRLNFVLDASSRILSVGCH